MIIPSQAEHGSTSLSTEFTFFSKNAIYRDSSWEKDEGGRRKEESRKRRGLLQNVQSGSRTSSRTPIEEWVGMKIDTVRDQVAA